MVGTKESQLYSALSGIRTGRLDTNLVYELSKDYVYQMILSIINNESESVTVFKTVYSRIFQELHTLAGPEYFYIWAGKIVTDESLNHVLRMGQGFYIIPDENVDFPYNSVLDDTENLFSDTFLEDVERQRILAQRLNELTLLQKIIMQYFYYDGSDVVSIGQRLGMTPKQVKKELQEIRGAIKDFVCTNSAPPKAVCYSFSVLPVLPFVLKNAIENALVTPVHIPAGEVLGAIGIGAFIGQGTIAAGSGMIAPGAIAGTGVVAPGTIAGTGVVAPGTIAGTGVVAPGTVAGTGVVAPGTVAGTGVVAPGTIAGTGVVAPGTVAGTGVVAPGTVAGTGVVAPGTVAGTGVVAPGTVATGTGVVGQSAASAGTAAATAGATAGSASSAAGAVATKVGISIGVKIAIGAATVATAAAISVGVITYIEEKEAVPVPVEPPVEVAYEEKEDAINLANFFEEVGAPEVAEEPLPEELEEYLEEMEVVVEEEIPFEEMPRTMILDLMMYSEDGVSAPHVKDYYIVKQEIIDDVMETESWDFNDGTMGFIYYVDHEYTIGSVPDIMISLQTHYFTTSNARDCWNNRGHEFENLSEDNFFIDYYGEIPDDFELELDGNKYLCHVENAFYDGIYLENDPNESNNFSYIRYFEGKGDYHLMGIGLYLECTFEYMD